MDLPTWCEYSNLPKYKYKLIKTLIFSLKPFLPIRRYEIKSLKNELLATIGYDGILTMYPGYCWDGATHAPDYPDVLRATVVHDILCQVLGTEGWPYNRKYGDRVFYEIAKQDRFKLAFIYYQALTIYTLTRELLRILYKPDPTIIVICFERLRDTTKEVEREVFKTYSKHFSVVFKKLWRLFIRKR